MPNLNRVNIIGSGLAGSEAAWFLAEKGVSVRLFEMRPLKSTPAHKTDRAAELVCSNSFKSMDPLSAPGILKADMREMGSLALQGAQVAQVPGGNALSVDRDVFAKFVTEKLSSHPKIERVNQEMLEPVADEINLIATGPLTSDGLAEWLAQATGAQDLYFYDAIAPIIDAASIDRESAFLANRYDKGVESGEEAAYLNCPMTDNEYYAFIDALMSAQTVEPKAFEKPKYFQGCQPIEAIAQTGRESLRFGPMKPVGLVDPRVGKRPYACLQLRPENKSLTAYNLVGFQTKLKYGEQSRIFRMIPALKNAEFLRLGSIHRNTYVCGPKVLRQDLSLRGHPKVYLAGQITGVEGYLESAAIGLMAANFIWQRLAGLPLQTPPMGSGMGALLKHVVSSDPANYQPMNACFAIFDPLAYDGLTEIKGKDELRAKMAEQSQKNFARWWKTQAAPAQMSV